MSDPARCLSLTVNGRRLEALAWGTPTGFPCLALHGWLDNANTFARLAPRLPQLHWVAIDLPGHGLSEHRSPDAKYHFIDWVGDVMAAADALGWQRFSLVGHSMGAAIAALCAGAYPNRVKRLALLDGLGPFSSEAEDVPARLG